MQFFSEEDEEEDEYVCADSVGVDEVDSAYSVLYQNPSRKLLENSEKMVMQGASELLASKIFFLMSPSHIINGCAGGQVFG